MKSINYRLREAAEKSDDAAIKKLLLTSRCNPKVANIRGKNVLMWAALHGSTSCVQLLIPVSNALACDENGWSALMYAASKGHSA